MRQKSIQALPEERDGDVGTQLPLDPALIPSGAQENHGIEKLPGYGGEEWAGSL